jgi:Tfp pilus assembly pilus retraction ATPase PilT
MSLTFINPATGLVVNSSMIKNYSTTTGLITITGQTTSGRVYTLKVTCRAGLYLYSNTKTLMITAP